MELLEAGDHPGGLVAGWKSKAGRNVEVILHQMSCQFCSLRIAFGSCQWIVKLMQVWKTAESDISAVMKAFHVCMRPYSEHAARDAAGPCEAGKRRVTAGW